MNQYPNLGYTAFNSLSPELKHSKNSRYNSPLSNRSNYSKLSFLSHDNHLDNQYQATYRGSTSDITPFEQKYLTNANTNSYLKSNYTSCTSSHTNNLKENDRGFLSDRGDSKYRSIMQRLERLNTHISTSVNSARDLTSLTDTYKNQGKSVKRAISYDAERRVLGDITDSSSNKFQDKSTADSISRKSFLPSISNHYVNCMAPAELKYPDNNNYATKYDYRSSESNSLKPNTDRNPRYNYDYSTKYNYSRLSKYSSDSNLFDTNKLKRSIQEIENNLFKGNQLLSDREHFKVNLNLNEKEKEKYNYNKYDNIHDKNRIGKNSMGYLNQNDRNEKNNQVPVKSKKVRSNSQISLKNANQKSEETNRIPDIKELIEINFGFEDYNDSFVFDMHEFFELSKLPKHYNMELYNKYRSGYKKSLLDVKLGRVMDLKHNLHPSSLSLSTPYLDSASNPKAFKSNRVSITDDVQKQYQSRYNISTSPTLNRKDSTITTVSKKNKDKHNHINIDNKTILQLKPSYLKDKKVNGVEINKTNVYERFRNKSVSILSPSPRNTQKREVEYENENSIKKLNKKEYSTTDRLAREMAAIVVSSPRESTQYPENEKYDEYVEKEKMKLNLKNNKYSSNLLNSLKKHSPYVNKNSKEFKKTGNPNINTSRCSSQCKNLNSINNTNNLSKNKSQLEFPGIKRATQVELNAEQNMELRRCFSMPHVVTDRISNAVLFKNKSVDKNPLKSVKLVKNTSDEHKRIKNIEKRLKNINYVLKGKSKYIV